MPLHFTPKEQAEQLRKPHGEGAESIAAYMKALNEALYAHVLKMLPLSPQTQMLEIGYGEGLMPEAIAAQNSGISYTGLDFSEEMLKMARAKNIPEATFLLGEAAQMPFQENQFDVCFAINVLYFWENPKREIAEIQRVLKPGGMLLFGYRPKSFMQAIPFTEFGFSLYETTEAEALLAECGFGNITTETEYEPNRLIAGKLQPMQNAVTRAQKAI
jgi:ubiquinone/menaquinone biosynthesis C-methylase UbiE